MKQAARRDALERRFGSEVVGARALAGRSEELAWVTPGELEGFREVLAYAASEGLRVAPAGLGSQLEASPPPPADLLLSTAGYAGVEAYEAGDGTLTARAGTPMDELVARARGGGHHLTPRVRGEAQRSLGGSSARRPTAPTVCAADRCATTSWARACSTPAGG